MNVIGVHYVVATTGSAAERIAELIWAGTLPPIARTAAEAIALADLHPGGMIPQPRAYRVYTGLARTKSSLLEPETLKGETACGN